MTVKAYPDYEESGVEWLGTVPKSWPIGRIKDSVVRAKNGVWGDDPTGGNDDVWCVRVADFDRLNLSVSDSERTIRSVPASDRLGRELQRGNLLLEKSGGGEKSPVGFVALFDHSDRAVCSNFIARVELGDGMDPKYWAYLHSTTYAVRLTQRSIKQTSGIQNLDQASYFNELTVYPPHDEQRQIADYLDAQTTKIDALIGKQELLIEKLAERRQAVISHAVTKGLDRSAPLKDSGHEWVGFIPAHWYRVPFVRLTHGRVDYRGATPTKTTDGVQLITARNVKRGQIDREASREFVSSENYAEVMRRGIPEIGDLLLTMEAPLGNVAIVDDTNIALAQRLILFRLNRSKITPAFANYLLNGFMFQEQIMSKATGSTALGLKASKLIELLVATPPLAEQTAIVAHLDREISQIDILAAKSREMIAVLKERRQALISAAVTGKIDVRGLA